MSDELDSFDQDEEELRELEQLVAHIDAAEEARFAEEIAAARVTMRKPVLVKVDDAYLLRRYLLARHRALTRSYDRSRACWSVLRAGLEHDDGVTVRELASEVDLPIDDVRVENQALRRMGFAMCEKAGPTGTWLYSVSCA